MLTLLNNQPTLILTHTRGRTSTHAHTHARTHARTHTYTHTYAHTDAHIHTHICTHGTSKKSFVVHFYPIFHTTQRSQPLQTRFAWNNFRLYHATKPGAESQTVPSWNECSLILRGAHQLCGAAKLIRSKIC